MIHKCMIHKCKKNSGLPVYLQKRKNLRRLATPLASHTARSCHPLNLSALKHSLKCVDKQYLIIVKKHGNQ